MMRSLAKLKEDFIWSSASDDPPDEVTDLPGWSEYRFRCLDDTALKLGNSSRAVKVVRWQICRLRREVSW